MTGDRMITRRQWLKASSLLTLGACGRSIVGPASPEPPDDMSRYIEQFDVRRFGAKPGYTAHTNSSTRGRNNRAAFLDCAAAITAHGKGGKMYIPGSEYDYWMGDDPDPIVMAAPYGCHVVGDGKRASRLRFEPGSLGSGGQSAKLLRFDTGSAVQGQCSAKGFTMFGYESSYSGTRYAKSMLSTYDGSEMKFEDLGVNDCQSLASTGTASEAFSGYGKELHSFIDVGFYADRPVGIHANPYEPGISCDGYSFYNSYLGIRAVGESGIHIDPDLNVLEFNISGATSIVGDTANNFGKYGIYWNDPTGPYDCVGFNISGRFRTEQMQDATGASIYINRGGTGRTIDVKLSGMNLNYKSRGIVLQGTINTLIEGCGFHHVGGVGVPLALDIGNTCQITTALRYMIPNYGTPLVQTTGQFVKYDSGDAALTGYELPTMKTWNII